MKTKIFFIGILIALYAGSVQGQIQKNTWMIGGDMQLLMNIHDHQNIGFVLVPTIGYTVVNNLVLGIDLTGEYSYFFDDRTYWGSFGIGPMIRYYFGKNNLMPFAYLSYRGEIGFRSISDDRSWDHSLLPGVGLTYMMNPFVGIEGLFRWHVLDYYKTLQFHIGLQVYLPPKV